MKQECAVACDDVHDKGSVFATPSTRYVCPVRGSEERRARVRGAADRHSGTGRLLRYSLRCEAESRQLFALSTKRSEASRVARGRADLGGRSSG